MNESGIRRPDQRVMLLNPERICCLGLPEGPSSRAFGSLTLYWAVGQPFRLCRDGRYWERRRIALLAPYQPHRVSTGGQPLGSMLMEPESLAPGATRSLVGDEEAVAGRLQHGYARLRALIERDGGVVRADVDRLLFGTSLEPARLDERVALVLKTLHHHQETPWSAREYARLVGLSLSRFLHLFKQETGVPFRRLRTWKRARSLLYHVDRDVSLTDIAMEIGYPDSSHFSHSIRRVYGLPPRDVIAGLRQLAVHHLSGTLRQGAES